MGIRGWRSEGSWNSNKDGTPNWEKYDELFAAAKEASCKIMSTPGGTPDWTWPFAPQQTPQRFLWIGTAAPMAGGAIGSATRSTIPRTKNG